MEASGVYGFEQNLGVVNVLCLCYIYTSFKRSLSRNNNDTLVTLRYLSYAHLDQVVVHMAIDGVMVIVGF